jgi:hypothetical protein
MPSTREINFSSEPPGMVAPAAPECPPPWPPRASAALERMSFRFIPFLTSSSEALAETLTPSSESTNPNMGFPVSYDLFIVETALDIMCSDMLPPARTYLAFPVSLMRSLFL